MVKSKPAGFEQKVESEINTEKLRSPEILKEDK